MFDKFNRCFHDGLANACRVMVRIGASSTVQELLAWHEWESYGLKRSTWIAAMVALLDRHQGGYRTQDLRTGQFNPDSNTLWQSVIGAFVDEGGFRVLVNDVGYVHKNTPKKCSSELSHYASLPVLCMYMHRC